MNLLSFFLASINWNFQATWGGFTHYDKNQSEWDASYQEKVCRLKTIKQCATTYRKFLVKRYSETILTTYWSMVIDPLRHNIDPFDSSVCQGEEYFHEGISYSIINVTGSTLCKVFPAENGTPFSKHPFVAKLLRGMFNKRQSLSRYAVTYDVVKVLQYISNSHWQMSSEVWKKFNNINVYFRWTKIPNHELTKYQLYAHIWYFTLHLF